MLKQTLVGCLIAFFCLQGQARLEYQSHQIHQQDKAVPVVAILVAAGLRVLAGSAVRSLSGPAAQTLARSFARGNLARRGKCFRVWGGDAAHMILSADKKTVLWAGDNFKVYKRKLRQLCH